MSLAEQHITLKSSDAILAVTDVVATVKFYREVLGFNREWLWGEPPTFAGMGWGSANLMFCQRPELAAKVEGHMHMFFTEGDIDALHTRHVAAGASIIEPVENKTWGVREYTIRDPNGYHLRFGGSPNYKAPAHALVTMPAYIEIVERLPTVEEYCRLVESVGWVKREESIPLALQNSILGVVAIDTRPDVNHPAVGMIRVVGDGVRFFYIQDVVVRPDYQSQRIGSNMMESIMTRLRARTPVGWASIGLFTGKPAFYERFGFVGGTGGMSMSF